MENNDAGLPRRFESVQYRFILFMLNLRDAMSANEKSGGRGSPETISSKISTVL